MRGLVLLCGLLIAGCGEPPRPVPQPQAATAVASIEASPPPAEEPVPQGGFAAVGALPRHQAIAVRGENVRFLQRSGDGWLWADYQRVFRWGGGATQELFAGSEHIEHVGVSREGTVAVVSGDKLHVLSAPRLELPVTRHTTVAWCGERLFAIDDELQEVVAGRLISVAKQQGRLSPRSCGGGKLALRVEGGMRVLDLATGSWTARLEAADPHWRMGYAVAVSDDGEHVAALQHMGTVRLWTSAGKALGHWPGVAGQAGEVAFSPDGKWLAAGRRVLSVPALRMVAQVGGGELAWTADGARLAVGEVGSITLWDVAGAARVPLPQGLTTAARSMLFDHDRGRLITSDQEGRLMLWSASTFKPLSGFESGAGGLDERRSLVLLPDGSLLVATEAAVGRWTQAGHRKEMRTIGASMGDTISASRDGTRVAIAGSDVVKVVAWASGKTLLETGSYRKNEEGFGGSVEGLSMHPDGELLAVGGRSKSHVLQLPGGKELARLKELRGYGNRVWFSASGRRLLHVTSMGARLYAWPAMTGIDLPEEAQWALNASFSPDDRELVLSAWSGNVVKLTLTKDGAAASVAWSAGGAWHVGAQAVDFAQRRLVTAGPDLELLIWDLDAGKIVDRRPGGGGRRTTALAFSPSGSHLAVGDGAGSLHVFDLGAGLRTGIQRSESVGEIEQVTVDDHGQAFGLSGGQVVASNASSSTKTSPRLLSDGAGLGAIARGVGKVVFVEPYEEELSIVDLTSEAVTKMPLPKVFRGEQAAVSPDGKVWLEVEEEWEPAKRGELARMIDLTTMRVTAQVSVAGPAGFELLGFAGGSGWVFHQAQSELMEWVPGRRQPRRLKLPDSCQPMAVSVAHIACSDGHWVTVLDRTTRDVVHSFVGHRVRIDAMAFDAAGTTLASADFYGNVWLWDIAAKLPRMRIVAGVGAWTVWRADGRWSEGGY
jgi:WD40 repeat protein